MPRNKKWSSTQRAKGESTEHFNQRARTGYKEEGMDRKASEGRFLPKEEYERLHPGRVGRLDNDPHGILTRIVNKLAKDKKDK